METFLKMKVGLVSPLQPMSRLNAGPFGLPRAHSHEHPREAKAVGNGLFGSQ